MPEIVILDGKYANPGDLSWEPVSQFGTTKIYESTLPDQIVGRSKDAEILVVNKIRLGKAEFDQLPKLRLICITATGTDNIRIDDARMQNIEVKNAVGYSTHSVAQHVLAMILHFTNAVSKHNQSVRAGQWDSEKGFSYTLQTIPQLSDKSIGIYGFGKIGKRVGELCSAFGMHVNVTSQHANPSDFPNYHFLSLDELFSVSDFISLHSPLTDSNKGIVNRSLMARMKAGSVLINTARGALVSEPDLYEALRTGRIAGAALDVLQTEPSGSSHPLFGLDNCVVTPHLAWTSLSARKELIRITADNIEWYIKEKRGRLKSRDGFFHFINFMNEVELIFSDLR